MNTIYKTTGIFVIITGLCLNCMASNFPDDKKSLLILSNLFTGIPGLGPEIIPKLSLFPVTIKELDSVTYYNYFGQDSLLINKKWYLRDNTGRIIEEKNYREEGNKNRLDVIFVYEEEDNNIYHYNDRGQVDSVHYYIPSNTYEGEMKLHRKFEYFYNVHEKIDSIIGYNNRGGIWKTHRALRYLFTYSPEGNLTECHNMSYHNQYFYKSQNNQPDSVFIEHLERGGYNTFPVSGSYYFTYYYNAKGTRTHDLFYRFDSTAMEYQPVYKDSLLFNEDGKNILRILYRYNSLKESWDITQKTYFSYDKDGDLLSEEMFQIDPASLELFLASQKRYFYKETVLGIANLSNVLSFNLYPIPAVDNIDITCLQPLQEETTYQIVNCNGQLLTSGIFLPNGAHTINISNLKSGLYFLRLQCNNGSGVQKFIKE